MQELPIEFTPAACPHLEHFLGRLSCPRFMARETTTRAKALSRLSCISCTITAPTRLSFCPGLFAPLVPCAPPAQALLAATILLGPRLLPLVMIGPRNEQDLARRQALVPVGLTGFRPAYIATVLCSLDAVEQRFIRVAHTFPVCRQAKALSSVRSQRVC